jgi:hypothetical protein
MLVPDKFLLCDPGLAPAELLMRYRQKQPFHHINCSVQLKLFSKMQGQTIFIPGKRRWPITGGVVRLQQNVS